MAKDHYSTLGVLPSASAADLRSAYLKLARANHPDKFSGQDQTQAEARMREINEAWNVLGVAHKRQEYDRLRPRGRSATAGSANGFTTGQSGPQRGHAHFRPFDDDDDPVSRPDLDFDDRPIPGSKGIPRWVAFLPIALSIAGVVILGFGTMVGASNIFALGLVCLIMGGITFLMLPLFVMSRADRDPDL